MENPEKDWFGFRAVTADEKTGLVDDVFSRVARRYDLMNDLMSGGIHRLWKDRFIREIRPRPHLRYLDVAGGTGDIAFRLRRKAGPEASITVADLNKNMLSVGRDRAIDRGWLNDFDWVSGNAESLPFLEQSFDVYTISFGLRNVTHIDQALKEAYRLLDHGGRFFCLEFSHVRPALLSKAYRVYSKTIIPNLGALIAKDRDSYQYLIESIERFPSQKRLQDRMVKAGFVYTRIVNLSGGIAAIHSGVKK